MPRSHTGLVLWMVAAACACVGFILLGNWQVQRLGWKRALIHDVNTRVHAVPVPTPGPAAWPRIEKGQLHYLHVRLKGHFLAGRQVLVHGSSKKGYGYWVMAPLVTDRGFVVMVNRGYVPSGIRETPQYAAVQAPAGQVVLNGLLRFSEPGGGFLRPNRPATGQWYSRDVAALAKADGLQAHQVAPYFVDADADADTEQGVADLPIGGLTRIHFRNPHLGYAITWYLLALGSLLGAAIVVRQEWRTRHGRAD